MSQNWKQIGHMPKKFCNSITSSLHSGLLRVTKMARPENVEENAPEGNGKVEDDLDRN